VLVVANEKGGSGKSTVAMHIAVALMKRGKKVATIDLDSRQRSLSRYVENRRAWSKRVGRELAVPGHICFDEQLDHPSEAGQSPAQIFLDMLDVLAPTYDAVIVDTPGHDGSLMRLAHANADVLITPLNDSFVGAFDSETLEVASFGHYAATVDEARTERRNAGQPASEWIVLRNRLSMTTSRNKRLVDGGLRSLSSALGFRYVEGLAERVVFREFYLRGLTALDELDEATLGARPTLSHVTARQEVERLLDALNLDGMAARSERTAEPERDAA
jgi:chromosome partitioning protein